MPSTVEVISGDDLPVPDLKPRETLGQVAERMARVVVFGESDIPGNDEIDAEILAEESAVARAFSRGARLNLPIETPKERVNQDRPRSRTKPKTQGDGRPAGSDEFSGLFAAGIILLITFAIGDWAIPTEQEANDLARPLANIMARRIDLAAKLGRDANDTIAFVIAVMAYMVRVGPLAAEKARVWNDDRQHRTRVNRVSPVGLDNDRGEDSISTREDAGSRPFFSEANHPLDALAKARATGLSAISRDLGAPSNGNLAVGGAG